jgi:NADH:ubiquinone oxidoreductase subunit E
MANPSITQDTQVRPQEQEETREKLLKEILSSYDGKKEELIPILQQVQQAFGYLPEPIMKKIAKFLQLSLG